MRGVSERIVGLTSLISYIAALVNAGPVGVEAYVVSHAETHVSVGQVAATQVVVAHRALAVFKGRV